MFNENDIAMLLAVVFGFVCGWGYYWFLFKPKQKRIKDYSGDRVVIQTLCGIELFNCPAETMHLNNLLYGAGVDSILLEQDRNAEHDKVQVIYVNNQQNR